MPSKIRGEMSKFKEITFLVILVTLSCCQCRIISQEFYPFGIHNGDKYIYGSYNGYPTGSATIYFNFRYPFFGKAYNHVHISRHGLISFGPGSPGNIYWPEIFPLKSFTGMAVYWTQISATEGNVFYRQTNNSEILNRTSSEIRTKFVEHQLFMATWALIVTYDSVSQYKCWFYDPNVEKDHRCWRNGDDTLTYQAILISDGIKSFAIFRYNRLGFTSSGCNCVHAQVGFNAGDGKRYYNVPLSNTPGVSKVALNSSNIEVPGMWMFKIDGRDIETACINNGELEIFPKKVLYFGGDDIIISGLCFNASSGNVSVKFDEDIIVVCQISSGHSLRCPAPYFTRLGWIEVKFTFRNILYATSIAVVDTSDKIITSSQWNFNTVLNQNGEIEIKWNASVFGSNNSVVQIRGFQIDMVQKSGRTRRDTEDFEYRYSTIAIPHRQVPNIGSFAVQLFDLLKIATDRVTIQSIGLVIEDYLLDQLFEKREYAVMATILLESDCYQNCFDWYHSQPPADEMSEIVDRESRRNPCPPSVPLAFPQMIDGFERDKSCNPDNPEECKLFHPGARGCYRSVNNPTGVVNQCCYNSDARLIVGPPGGGTIDFGDSSRRIGIIKHFFIDVLSYYTCCKCSNNCDRYYDKRPSIDSRYFLPTRFGNGGGDPHFTTIDGTEYTFNAIGEFVYLTSPEDTVQVRMSQFRDSFNDLKQACYFSSFVVSCTDCDVIQVELSELKFFQFRLNGKTISFDYGTWKFKGIILHYMNSTLATVGTPSGLGAEFSIAGGILNVISSLPEAAKGRVHGIIGDWDDNPDNDLQLPNGTFIPVNSSIQDIHYIFGLSWSTTNSTSLFTYPTGLSWADFQNTHFTPDFSEPPPNLQCNGNDQCNYDARVTGDVQVGLANLVREARVIQLVEANEKMSTLCPTAVTVNNGNVTVTKHNDSNVIYFVTCKKGYSLDGNAEIACLNGKYYSLPVCLTPQSSTSSTPKLVAFPYHLHIAFLTCTLLRICSFNTYSP